MSRSRRGARGRKPAGKPELSAAFWGHVPEGGPAPIRVSDDPSAMVRSLGPPPLKGHEVPAQYTFRLVYEKAASLAGTLAAAAELDGQGDGQAGDEGGGSPADPPDDSSLDRPD
jgi:hypothetical protein